MVALTHVDMADLERDRPAFVRALGSGLEALGFVIVTGHDIDATLLDEVYRSARAVFALPESTKVACERPEIGRQRGYTSFGRERAANQTVADLKEFWMVGRESITTPNVFPDEVPAFRTSTVEYFSRCEAVALQLLSALGEFLGMADGDLAEMAEVGTTCVRVLHYPDVDGAPPVGAVRAAAHEDINFITLLPASTSPGLELLTHEGKWVAVETKPGDLIVDTGDMMRYLTGGRMPATTHRVVNPTANDGGRLSLPCFVHPRREVILTPPDPTFGPPIASGDLLDQRLRENGVL
ncbi:MAG: isopenicillin N synthase-like dioxygenase [Myxococcota bacterium]|jgi:isopenicillin N synthase-like dioxygenase